MSFPLSRRALLAASFITVVSGQAIASNDGELCRNPLGLVVCGALQAAQALSPVSGAERLEQAATAGRVDELKRLVAAHPDSVDAMKLLVLAVGHLSSSDTGIDDRLSMFAFLLDQKVPLDDERMAWMLQTVAASQHPRRIEALNLWLHRGVSARDVVLADRTIGWGTEGPDVLRLLVKHGADPNRRALRGDPPLLEALRTRNLATAELLLELGADPNAPMSRAEPSSLMRLVTGCGSRRPCGTDTLRIIEFMLAHGADPNGKARPDGDCITPLDMARLGHDEVLEAMLLRFKADPDFRCAR